jgi:hypothetical protein
VCTLASPLLRLPAVTGLGTPNFTAMSKVIAALP